MLRKTNKALAVALFTGIVFNQVMPVYAAEEIKDDTKYIITEEPITKNQNTEEDFTRTDENNNLSVSNNPSVKNENSEEEKKLNNQENKEENSQTEDKFITKDKEDKELTHEDLLKKEKDENKDEDRKTEESNKEEQENIQRTHTEDDKDFEKNLEEDNERQDILDKSIIDNSPVYGYYLPDDSVRTLKFKADRLSLFEKYKKQINTKDNVKLLEVKGNKAEEDKNNLFLKYLDGIYDAKDGYESRFKYYKGGLVFPLKKLEVLSLYKESNPRVVLKSKAGENIYAPISAKTVEYNKTKKELTLVDEDQNIRVVITNIESKDYINVKAGDVIGKATGDNISFYLEKNKEYINPILSIRTEIDKETDGFLGAPNLYQIDSRWGFRPYGNMNISSAACGPSSLSIAISYITGKLVTPEDVVEKFGGAMSPHFISGVGSSFSIFPAAQAEYDVVVKNIGNINNAVKELSKGNPVVTSMTPGYFTRAGHFITLTGLSSEGRIYVNDPASQVRGEQTYLPSFIQSQMKGAWSIESPYGQNTYTEKEPKVEDKLAKLKDKICTVNTNISKGNVTISIE